MTIALAGMEAPPWDARIIAAELDFRTEHSNPLTRNSPCKGINEEGEARDTVLIDIHPMTGFVMAAAINRA